MPFESLNSPVDPAENVTRYVFERGHFSAQKREIKYKAWEPPKSKLVSVYRIINLSEGDIWKLGQEQAERLPDRRILARADVGVQLLLGLGLQIVADEPPPRHANISGWPEEKDARISKAQELAAASAYQQRPEQPIDL